MNLAGPASAEAKQLLDSLKREDEIDPLRLRLRLRPHPYEFELYDDV